MLFPANLLASTKKTKIKNLNISCHYYQYYYSVFWWHRLLLQIRSLHGVRETGQHGACWVTAAAHTKVMADRQCWRLRLWVNHGHRVCRKRGLPRSLALSHSECRTLCVPGLWSIFKATLHAVHCGGQPTTRLNCVIKFMASAAEWWQKLLSEEVGGRDQHGRVGQGQHHGIREGNVYPVEAFSPDLPTVG